MKRGANYRVAEVLEQRVMLSIPATPFQTVQASVDDAGVHFSVQDPARNALRKGVEGLRADQTASTVLNNSGIVAWSTSWRDYFDTLYTNVFYKVYDVQKGSWQGGQQELFPGETLGALTNNGGAVSWSATRVDSFGNTHARVSTRVYDPQKGVWRGSDTAMDTRETLGTVVNNGGVVAWSASSRDLRGDTHQRVFYQVYDPQRGAWRTGRTDLDRNETASTISIANCTVSWTTTAAAYTRGYDPVSGNWTAQTSKPLAFFYGGSYIGSAVEAPFTLYLWDMSIGATGWSWDFGDNSTGTTRAPTHAYSTVGAYTLTQTATNSGVSSTQQVTVRTDAVAPTDVVLSNSSVPEHRPRGFAVGTFGAAGQGRFRWTLVDGEGSDDNSRFRISGSQLRTNARFDYTTRNTYSIRVRTTAASGASTDNTFAINVLNMFDLSWTGLAVAPGSLTQLGGTLSVKRTYRIADRPAGSEFAVQYRLSADQIWGNEDDIVLAGDEVISSRRGKAVGTHARTVKLHVGQLPAGSYFLLAHLDATNAVTNENSDDNNVVATPLQINRPAFGWINGVNQVMKVTDSDGDLLRFSVTGPGAGELTGDDLSTLALTGTTAASVLRINVTRASGGDGRMSLKGITSDGLMKQITGNAVVISGDVTLNSLLVAPAPGNSVAITLADVTGILNTNGLTNTVRLLG